MNGVNQFVPRRSTMVRRMSPLWLMVYLVLALIIVAGCMPVQPATPAQAITLRFGFPDGEDRPIVADYVREFAAQVNALSQGKITIEPVWRAGDETFDGYEKGTLQRVLQGKYDMGVVASRTWDSENITNFQALQAPFLITND